ncbi:type II secretion system F family protein, partial [Singulisphaera rosea]
MRRALDAGSSLSDHETTELARRIADLAAAGLPLPSGLRALAEELPRRRVRECLVRLADAMDAGVPLDAALGALKPQLPSYLRGLILAAVRTGNLGQVLGRFAGYCDIGADLRRSVMLRLIPSLASLAFAIAIFIFGSTQLIPDFKTIYKDLGAPPLEIIRAIFAISDAIQAVWRPVVQGLLILSACWAIACLVLPKEIRRGLLADIPVLGDVWRLTA